MRSYFDGPGFDLNRECIVNHETHSSSSSSHVAVAIGFIALAGVAAETGVVMLIYLDHAWRARAVDGHRPTLRDLYDAVVEGAVERVRPKMMTVTAIIAGLLPILWGTAPARAS